MTRTLFALAVGLTLAASTHCPAAAQQTQSPSACLAVTASNPAQATYNPLVPSVAPIPFTVTITPLACAGAPTNQDLEFWFRDDNPTGSRNRELGRVPFQLRFNSINYLYGEGVGRPANVLQTSVGPNGASLPFELFLSPSELDATSGTSEISLYYAAPGEPMPQRTTIQVQMALAAAFDLSLEDGSSNASLNLGTLAPGSSGTLNLRARGTQPYRIGLISQYGGSLRRTDVCGSTLPSSTDPLETIPYAVTVRGVPVSPGQSYVDATPDGASLHESILPVTAQIPAAFDPRAKRAGHYCDVVTLRVEAY